MQNSALFSVYNASAGSGKTFMLVKEYLKILLTSSNPFKFQQILAVTFTNKAAGEMKTRIIENLHQFSKNEQNKLLPLICNETELDEALVFKRSQVVLNAIMQNYSAFNVTTIDSFTYKIIRTFSFDLGLSLNATVELDAESLLNEAVDLVISKIGIDAQLTKLLINYALQKSDDDKSWDIAKDLRNFSRIILNEDDWNHLKLLDNVSIDEFEKSGKILRKEAKEIESAFSLLGKKGLELIKNAGIQQSEFAYGGELPKHFEKLKKLKNLKVDDLKFDGRLNKTVEENKNFYAVKTSAELKASIDAISEELKALYYQSKELYEQKFGIYVLNNLIIESLVPMAVLDFIYKSLQEIKSDNNVLLNAEFNQLISDSIKNEPAPFIYERLGEKFRYYFIDEMQDTSQLQWQNLIPLVENALISETDLGEKGKLLLVGDAKQSIYRWRGGKAEQFIDLSKKEESKAANPFYVSKKIEDLTTNYRSCETIIDFNNQFFRYSSRFLSNPEFAKLFLDGNNQNFNSKKGGFVQISLVEKNTDDEEKDLVFPKKVAEIIQNLDSSFEKSDVCVLVRTRKQGVSIATYLTEIGVEIISSETLLLKNNALVNFITTVLYVINDALNQTHKANVLYFLYQQLNLKIPIHQFIQPLIELDNLAFFEQLKKVGIEFNLKEFTQHSLFESIEYVVRAFKLAPESDTNIQFFLDVVFEFQQKKQADLSDFLLYWELKNESLSIVAPEAKNAVRIMTIHKAKGLEFQIVIFPFDISIYNQINPKVWYNLETEDALKTVLINYGSKLNYIGKQGIQLYEERRKELEFDNFNVLYVALTRAIEQLYIVTSAQNKFENQLKNTSNLFVNFLVEQKLFLATQFDYQFGNSKRSIETEIEENNTIAQQQFISNSWKNNQINIATNASLLWDTEKGEAILYGNLIHEMLSKIITESDINNVLQSYIFKGIISKSEEENLLTRINRVVNNAQLQKYYKPNLVVFTERELILETKEILIPDRLIFENNYVTIIDYKTGKPEGEHKIQVNKYAKALENLQFIINKKILVYIKEEIIVEEVE